jgi:hypothetical protein
MSSSSSPRKRKPGPRPFVPTTAQRRRVTRGISIGLTLQEIADALEMPVRSLTRVFGAQIRTARVRMILDNLDRLHAAADAGNVSAMRELARMMQHAGGPAEAGEDDPWTALGEQLAEEANLARISDFGKPN